MDSAKKLSESIRHEYTISLDYFKVKVYYFGNKTDTPYFEIYHKVFKSDPFSDDSWVQIDSEEKDELMDLLTKAMIWVTSSRQIS